MFNNYGYAKLTEKRIMVQFYNILEQINLLTDAQCGCLAALSTNIIVFTNYHMITSTANMGNFMISTYLNLGKFHPIGLSNPSLES